MKFLLFHSIGQDKADVATLVEIPIHQLGKVRDAFSKQYGLGFVCARSLYNQTPNGLYYYYTDGSIGPINFNLVIMSPGNWTME